MNEALAERMSNTGAARELVALRSGYLLGAVAYAAGLQVVNVLLLRFLTDTLAMSAALGGLLLAATRLYDAVIDPLVGVASDRTHSRWGRRRPWLLAGALTLPLSIIAMFNAPALPELWLAVYMIVVLMAHGTAYAAFVVPYTALGTELVSDYHERSRLMSYRVYGGSLGLLLAASFAPWLLSMWGADRAGHGSMGLAIALPMLLAGLGAVYLLREPELPETSTLGLSLKERLKLGVQNRPFRTLVLVHVFFQIGVAGVVGSTAFYSRWILGVSDAWLGAFYLAKVAGNLVSMPLWLWMSRRFDKKRTYIVALMAYGALNLTWLASGPGDPMSMVLGRMLLIGIAMGGCVLLGYSLLADVIRLDQISTGLRREGTFSGVMSFIDKAANSLGIAGLGVLFSAMGYVAARGNAVQPDSALHAILIGFSVIPGVAALICILLMRGYQVRREDLGG